MCCYRPNTDVLKNVAKSSSKHFVRIYKTTRSLIPEVRIFTFMAVGISNSIYDRVLPICYKMYNLSALDSKFPYSFSVYWRRGCSSWFQTFAMFWMSYAFCWVIPWRPNFICQRFGTLSLFHLHMRVGMNNNWVIKFGRQGITQKKAYNMIVLHFITARIPLIVTGVYLSQVIDLLSRFAEVISSSPITAPVKLFR